MVVVERAEADELKKHMRLNKSSKGSGYRLLACR